jgi:hypothetical protein
VSAKSKTLVNRARLEMDNRLDRVNKSLESFFENDVSGNFLGLPQPAWEHLERFRCFLKSYYTTLHGLWPPAQFEEEDVQQEILSTMLSHFQILYQHLVDPESSIDIASNDVSQTGGLCTLQNIQAFDKKHSYESLAQPLPRLPEPFDASSAQSVKPQRRMSWNLKQKRKALRETRKVHDKKALVAATNQDILLMDCALVQRYAEFEETTVDDQLEGLSAVEGRKVRWILVYVILQTFQSIALSPKEVRSVSKLSYSLCCRAPTQKPWQDQKLLDIVPALEKRQSCIDPDNSYSHTNMSTASLGEPQPRGRQPQARRRTLPAGLPASLKAALSTRTPPASRSTSLRRLVSRRGRNTVEEVPAKKASFCEIYIEGYGNGLNPVLGHSATNAPSADLTSEPESVDFAIKEEPQDVPELHGEPVHEMPTNETDGPLALATLASEGTPSTPPSMSRESSSASISGVSSHTDEDEDLAIPTKNNILTLVEILQSTSISSAPNLTSTASRPRPTSLIAQGPDPEVKILGVDDPNPNDDPPYVHFNTLTWDKMLEARPLTSSAQPAVAA